MFLTFQFHVFAGFTLVSVFQKSLALIYLVLVCKLIPNQVTENLTVDLKALLNCIPAT